MLSTQYRARETMLRERFLRQLRAADFPCVGAKAALARDQIEVLVARDLTSAWDDLRIYRHLRAFAADYTRRRRLFSSFAVIFDGPRTLDETSFERHLWDRLQSLHAKDLWHGQPHDVRVDSDPASPHFGMSFGGEAFFVVGCTPRRAGWRGASPSLCWSSTSTTSSNGCAPTAVTRRCARPSSIATPPIRDRSTRCSPFMVRSAKPASIADATSRRTGAARSARSGGNWPMQADIATGPRRRIPPRSGTAFVLTKGQRLTIIDPQGEQVADLVAYARRDPGEVISSGRSLDYASKLFLTTGDPIYSNRSNIMFRIVEDDVGRHDFLLTPCSEATFRIIYGDIHPHRGCFGNLADALAPYGIAPDAIPVAFNVFMNVRVDGESGALTVAPPLSKAGDRLVIEAAMDLIVGLTACSALQSNNFAFKPIDYRID